ncbi:MAG: FlgD immunoglobulin-like domain containing protein [Candidatus Kapaibacterium sp.]
MLIASGLFGLTQTASAQKRYVYFPTYDVRDAHFLSIAGSGIATLAGQNIYLTLTSPAAATSLEIGVFDGETGGMWDVGTVPLEYTLFADPTADGTGTTQVGTWRGDAMPDNAWYAMTVTNSSAARSAGGAYFYTLRIRSTDPTVTSWSNFKVRTDGSLTLRAGQPFAINAPLTSLATALVVYPLYPVLEPTNYDGSWTFYLNASAPIAKFEMWDGDLDFGSWDCYTMDSDDPDTPADSLPAWATGTPAVPEGVARGSMACIDGDTATSEPPDDALSLFYRRSPSIVYEVIDPNGNFYTNNNPSGNLEWEQFLISTAPEDRNKMDYHADSLPAGIYQVHITGMDMQNLDAWRFGNSTNVLAMTPLGVDSTGTPVVPPSPAPQDTAVITGTLFYDGNSNGAQDATDEGIDVVTVNLAADYNNDGVVDKRFSTVTDDNGHYVFANLKSGRYTITIDQASLGSDLTPTYDPDGIATPNSALIVVDATHQRPVANFGYHQNITGCINGPDTVVNCTSTSFTVTTNQTTPTYKWTITGSGTISGSSTSSTVTVNAACSAGTYTLSVTITKNGSSRTIKKTVVVIVPGTDFVLFAYNTLYFKGRYCDNTRGFITGNVGVNNKARTSSCSGTQPNLTLGGGCSTHSVYVSDGSKVMGDYVDLGGSKVSVYDLYANRATGASSTAIKRHSYVTSLSLPIIASTNLPIVPSFTYGCNNVTVSSTTTLAPGKYGTITVRDYATLNLAAGIYNIKSLIAGRHTHINTNTATKVRIASKLYIDDDGYVGPANYALFIVRSDGLCSNDASVAFNERTEFHGQVFAPNGLINLGKGTDLFGRFWSASITSDYDVNATYASPVSALNRNNNDGFQKKQLENGAVTGETPSISLMQNYPNPFRSTTTIGFNLAAAAPVTVTIIDANGHSVKTLLDAATMQQGANSVAWDGHGENGEILPSGTYFYRVECDGVTDTKPLVLTRD